MRRRPQRLAQLPGLVIVPRPRHVTIDFLKADEIGVLGLDDLDDPIETIEAVAAADPLVDVVAQKAHGHPSSSWSGRFSGSWGLLEAVEPGDQPRPGMIHRLERCHQST